MGLKINYQKTIDDLVERRVARVHLSKWNEWDYLKLQYTEDGMLTPWGKLYGLGSSVARDIPTVMAFTAEEGLWEEWRMPDDYEERHNEIYRDLDELMNLK